MIERQVKAKIQTLLQEFPAVALLGPRQVGKTTLAMQIAQSIHPDSIYLDLESPVNQNKLRQPEEYFELHKGKLIILDEIHRLPELFSVLRGIIDRWRQEGFRTGQFLILGSASRELLKQSSESLAGRIAYIELTGLNVLEIETGKKDEPDRLWLRGGFPDSFLSVNDEASLRWRLNFIATYLERDLPQLGPRIPAVTLRNLWTMLAHMQGGQLNMAQLGAGLFITIPTVTRYIELLEDLLLIRTLLPWAGNIGKRLVRAPKVYIRDSGLTHALLNLAKMDDIFGHPVAGPSWESFVIENLLSVLPENYSPLYYRSAAGAEIDLVLEKNDRDKWAIEIKRSHTPSVTKGFHLGCDDIGATKRYIVYPGHERYALSDKLEAIPLNEMMRELSAG